MIQKLKAILFIIISIYIFTGCASKEDQEYNKPAIYWYNKMIKQISTYQLDQADDTYISLESEHRNSPLLPSAIMIIAYAHMQEDEYTMANYYFDEYLKRFSLKKNADYIRYLKIKTNFLAFKQQFRDQELLQNTLKESEKFLQEYKNSQYIYLVQTIKSRLLMTKAIFDKNIADLYSRLDKPKASDVYKEKVKQSWQDTKNIEKVKVPFYRAIFE